MSLMLMLTNTPSNVICYQKKLDITDVIIIPEGWLLWDMNRKINDDEKTI